MRGIGAPQASAAALLCVGVAEAAHAGARDAEARAAVRIGTGHLGVGGHPVVALGRALLGRQQRQQRGQRIEREALAGRQGEVLAVHLEVVADAVAAHHRPLGGDDLDAQIVQRELVVLLGRHRE